MANSVETVATFYGIALAGGVIVPINTRYRARELPFVISNAELAMIVTSDRIDDYVDLLALLAEALPLVESAPTIVALGDREAPGTITQAAFDAFADTVTDDDLDHRRLRVKVGGLAVLLFTSGTTSQPRACVLSHEALVRNWTTFGHVFRLQPGEKCWAPGPMFHLGAIGPIADELRDGRGDADRRLVRPDARARAARPRAAGDPLPRLSADHDGRARAPALRRRSTSRPRARSSTSARPTCCARSRTRCRTRRW